MAEWAGKLASKSPVMMRLGKDAMFRQQDMAFVEAVDFLRSQLTIAFSTEDIHEGVKAFFEKREPVWTRALRVVNLRGRTSDRTAGAPAGAQALALTLGGRVVGEPGEPRVGDWREDLPASEPVLDAAEAELEAAFAAGELPVLTASDCTICIATLPAVVAHDPGVHVVWLDAHGDFNTPETTRERLPRRHVPGRRLRALGRRPGRAGRHCRPVARAHARRPRPRARRGGGGRGGRG